MRTIDTSPRWLSGANLALALCLGAAGCHFEVSGEHPGGGARGTPAWRGGGGLPPEGGACARDADCGVECYCDLAAQRCVLSTTCWDTADCRPGFVCDERSTCVPRRDVDRAGGASGGVGAGGAGGTATGGAGGTARAGGAGGTATGGAGGMTSPGGAGGTGAGGGAGTGHACPVGAELSCGAGPSAPAGEPVCRFDPHCGGGRCEGGLCFRACTGRSDCGTGDICLSGICRPNPGPGGQCVFDGQCAAPGATCINGTCHAPCARDGDCACEHDRCERGLCRPDRRPVAACQANRDCGPTQACVDAICRTMCFDDGACAPGSACRLGYCME